MVIPARTISFVAAIFIMLFTGSLSDTSPVCSGVQGPPGLDGRDGRDGINGLKGDPGPPGAPGSVGPPGKEGPRGDRGTVGIPGQRGERGLPGFPGQQGEKGEKGSSERPGLPGQRGDRGLPGFPGIPGQRGDSGLPGFPGKPGEKGEKGDSSGQSDVLTNIQSKLSSLEAQVNELQLSISAKTKALLFARVVTVGEKTFVTNGKELTYNESKAICLRAGGQIATPRTSEENTAVLNVAQYYAVSPYLGITDIQTEGTFQYSDGKSITYSNWNSGKPNQDGEEDCVEMQLDGKWNDKRCEEKRLIICEFE